MKKEEKKKLVAIGIVLLLVPLVFIECRILPKPICSIRPDCRIYAISDEYGVRKVCEKDF